MAKAKGSVVPVSGEDVITCLKALREDTSCEGRIIIRLAPGNDSALRIEVAAYTDVGTPVGVARELHIWTGGLERPLLTRLMMMLHVVYHKTCEHAFKR